MHGISDNWARMAEQASVQPVHAWSLSPVMDGNHYDLRFQHSRSFQMLSTPSHPAFDDGGKPTLVHMSNILIE